MTDEVKSEKKKRGRPANIEIVCGKRNIFTSKGKVFAGQSVTLPAAEAKAFLKDGFAMTKDEGKFNA